MSFKGYYNIIKQSNSGDVCEIFLLQELSSKMGNRSSKSENGEEPVKTTLFEKEASGIIYRIPALLYLRHTHTFLAFAEKRSSPCDHDARILVMRRGLLKDDGSVQVIISARYQQSSLHQGYMVFFNIVFPPTLPSFSSGPPVRSSQLHVYQTTAP